jgi:hypothetical protein
MKYVIPENRMKTLVIKYLDSIDWRILEVTESSAFENESYPLEVYEHTTDKGPTFIVNCFKYKFGESCNLLISHLFQKKLISLFGEETVNTGEEGEPNLLVMDWFNQYFKTNVHDYRYVDNRNYTYDEDII